MEIVYLLWKQTKFRRERTPSLMGVFRTPIAAKLWYDQIGHLSARQHISCRYCELESNRWGAYTDWQVRYEDDDVYYHVWIEPREIIL